MAAQVLRPQQKRKNSRSKIDRRSDTAAQIPAPAQAILRAMQRGEKPNPGEVMVLQRAIGNRATQSLIQREGEDDKKGWQRGTTPTNAPRSKLTIGVSNSSPIVPTFGKQQDESLHLRDLKFGAFKGFKGGKKIVSTSQTIAESTGTTSSVISPTAYAEQFQSAASGISNAVSGGSIFGIQEALSAFLGVVMPYIKIVKLAIQIPLAIIKIHKTRGDLKSLKAAYKAARLKGDQGDTAALAVAEAAIYGYNKVRRRFAESIAKVIIKISKFAMILADIISGGTAIMFTSIGKLLNTVATMVIKGHAAIKSLVKTARGTKGVNRNKNAEVIIKSALANQPEAMHLMYKMKIGKKLFVGKLGKKSVFGKLKDKVKGNKVNFFKNNERGYYVWLRALKGDDWNKLRDELTAKLRSTTMKSLTAKLKKAGIIK